MGKKILYIWTSKVFFGNFKSNPLQNFALILPKYMIFIRMAVIKTFCSYVSILKNSEKLELLYKSLFN